MNIKELIQKGQKELKSKTLGADTDVERLAEELDRLIKFYCEKLALVANLDGDAAEALGYDPTINGGKFTMRVGRIKIILPYILTQYRNNRASTWDELVEFKENLEISQLFFHGAPTYTVYNPLVTNSDPFVNFTTLAQAVTYAFELDRQKGSA